jgi:uncharacterized protein YabN with tetrapyrrole methylase and pyrophosphatase domain
MARRSNHPPFPTRGKEGPGGNGGGERRRRGNQKKGSLLVVGTGIESFGQMTAEAKLAIEEAQKVFYVVADPLGENAVKALNRTAESLHGLYEAGKHRLKTYSAMVDRVLAEVRKGKRVAFVLYGHPGVFALPSHVSVKLAKKEGFAARMLPGVSADACLIADLGVDPATHGWQSYEATDFLLRKRRPDPGAGLLLWQIGVLGRFDYTGKDADSSKLKVMTEVLLETYPPKHEVWLYEASPLPGFPPTMRECEVQRLHEQPMSAVTTLYVPPSKLPPIDPAMQERLGVKTEMQLSCLKQVAPSGRRRDRR